MDGYVGIAPSQELEKKIQEALIGMGHQNLPPNLSKLLEGDQDVILGVEELKWISKNIACISGLGNLLLSSSLQLPKLMAKERNKDLEKRCVKLRAEQEDKEYRKMTDNVRRDNVKNKEDEPIKKQLAEVNKFLLLILQFVVSVVCAFMFGYMGPYLLYGRQDVGGRLLLGIVLGFVVGCADMYFVIRQLLEEDGIKLKKIE